LTEEQQRTNTDKLPEGADNIINEVMEYEPEMLVPNIDDHIFPDDDEIDNETGNDEEEVTLMNDAGIVGRPCLIDLVEVGWNKLREMNLKKVRMVADKRAQWKKRTAQYVMNRVIVMKQDLMTTSIPVEQDNVEESEWVADLRELRHDYYD
jgi:hypothetical protein